MTAQDAQSPDPGDVRAPTFYVRAYTARGGYVFNGVTFPTLEAAAADARATLTRNASLIGCAIISDRAEVARIMPDNARKG